MPVKTIRLTAESHQTKTMRGAWTGHHHASYRDLATPDNHPSHETALARLTELIEFRCTEESARVRVLVLRRHVGIFTYDIHGYVSTRHVWPDDGHIAHQCGGATMESEQRSFRYHVAQLTWNFAPECESELLPADLQAEYRSWQGFQFAYRDAKSRGMSDIDAHSWACGHAREFEPKPDVELSQPVA